MNGDCLFCKIVKGEIPCQKIYENEHCFIFEDKFPMTKIHYLVIHKNHSENINDLMNHHENQLLDIFRTIRDYTEKAGIQKQGYRLMNNMGKDGGQTVFHTHFHLFAGEKLPMKFVKD